MLHLTALARHLIPTTLLSSMSALLLVSLLAPTWAQAEDAPPAPAAERALYFELKPTFVTNFGPSESRKLMYVKTDITLSLNGSDAEDAAMRHAPALRHAVVMLLSQQSEAAMSTGSGRETVLNNALEKLNEVFEREEGETMVLDVMFTNLLLQR